MSGMPHEYRGVCTNCHQLPDPNRFNANPYRTQAGTAVAAAQPMAAPPMMAPAKTPTEGEWMGLEVTPITPLTARQYGIRDGTRGLVVAEAEAQAALVGIRAGDLLVAVNEVPITGMTDFFQATRNGTMTQGVVEILRQGQRLAVDLAPTTAPAWNAGARGGRQGIAVAGGGGLVAPCQRQF
jgi:S1-C subfamily serine protease